MSVSAEKFYRHIYGGGAGLLALFSGARTSSGELDEDNTRTRYFDYPARIGAALTFAAKESRTGREVWHCAHLLTKGRRVKENAAPILTLWGDLDGAAVPNGSLKPTAVVESSPGRFHCYWRLSEEVRPELAEGLNKRLARAAAADPSGFDLTQLLRVPDTANHKYPDAPVVKVLRLDGGRFYAYRELDEALPEIEERREPQSRDRSGDPPVLLDERALQVWRGEDPKLKEDGTVDRSSTLVKVGRVLYDAGANRPVIEAALEERDRALGYNKYTGRRDALECYVGVVDELEENGRNPRLVSGAYKQNGCAGVAESAAEASEGGWGVLLSEVRPERVRWLWDRRIALGKLNLVDGDPGTGKSAATTDLAARVSVGKPWPDGAECKVGGVVILSAEDGLADTIRPRFDAAGGDPSKAVAVSTVPDGEGNERQIAIPDDLHVIEAAIERVGALLVVVDPLMAFLPGDVNSHRDQDVRRALAPLARLAERTGAAVVVVRHLNKGTGGNALYRGGGSIGIVGAARSGLLIAKHPEDDGRRVLASIKSNLAAPAPSLVFGLSGTVSGAVRVDWKGESSLDACALLSAPTDPEERSALEEAKDFIQDILDDGPVAAKDAESEGRQAGIEPRTLKRAKQKLGVVSERQGGIGERGSWYWRLPDGLHAAKGAKPNDGPLSNESDRSDDENAAYVGHKRVAALRGPNAEEVTAANGHGPLNAMLSVGEIGAQTRRSKSGPALALKTYLEKPGDQRLEWLTKAVLTALNRNTASWEKHAAAVKTAAEDPANHPLDCECGACV